MDFTVSAAGFELACTLSRFGDDCLVTISGGDAAHIGCTVMAVPRPSLTGVGRSATVSVLNRLGHKDDFLATPIAQQVAAELDCVVVCTAGVHVDDATPQQIAAIQDVVPTVAKTVAKLVGKEHPDD